jgi:serine phosphatase RsbU (regulator of sigma subunit)
MVRAVAAAGVLALVPAFGLAVAAGLVGVSTPLGMAAAGGAVIGLGAAIALGARRPPQGLDDIARRFLLQALRAATVEKVASEIQLALADAFGGAGVSRAMLVLPDGEGVRVLTLAGNAIEIGDPVAAFAALGDAQEPLARAAVVAATTPVPEAEAGADGVAWAEFLAQGARDVLALLDRTGTDLLLPLHHRGLLLGVLLLTTPPVKDAASELRFWRALRAYATAAIARAFLGVETKGRTQLVKSLDLATAMQESMMPDERPVRRRTFELRGLYRPVAECGGDLWMWHELGEGRVLLVIADATGHGAAPALLAAVAKGTIDARWQLATADGGSGDLDPALLLTELNRVIHRAGRRQYQMTAFACVLDTNIGVLRFANAGQNFPYRLTVRADVAPAIEALVARGNTLGAEAEARYVTRTMMIAPGDRLVLYTDGLIDAGTPYRDAFGDKRLRAALVDKASERGTRLPELLLADIEAHAAGAPLGDDVTVLTVEILDVGAHA